MKNLDEKIKKISFLRNKLKKNQHSIGTFLQLNSPESAEIISSSNYDWIVIDMEHGVINHNHLVEIIRAIEINSVLPLVRVVTGNAQECKKAFDSGASGIVIPMVENSKQLKEIISFCKYPPAGQRGVAFSRANMFGKNFKKYLYNFAQNPIIIAMIENKKGVKNLKQIVKVKGLDGILIGPYDLSASLGCPGDFQNDIFLKSISFIKNNTIKNNIPCGIHIVETNIDELKKRVKEGYTFIGYSMDTTILSKYSKIPKI